MQSWPIVRTQPLGKTYGRGLPSFINNRGYYFDLLGVYADGVVDCWDMLDLALFRRKAQTGWIALQPPLGAHVSVHNLGFCKVDAAEWQLSVADLVEQVEAVVTALNPQRAELVDLEGEASRPFGPNSKARIAKLGLADEYFQRLAADGADILGRRVPLLLRDGASYVLTPGAIYADGMCQLRMAGDLLSTATLIEQLERGEVGTSVADGSWVEIEGLGCWRSVQGHWPIEPGERSKEIADVLAILNGAPGALKTCRAAFADYQRDPAPAAKERLRSAYAAVPGHLRMYCGDMDSKDWPIRAILFGEHDEYGE